MRQKWPFEEPPDQYDWYANPQTDIPAAQILPNETTPNESPVVTESSVHTSPSRNITMPLLLMMTMSRQKMGGERLEDGFMFRQAQNNSAIPLVPSAAGLGFGEMLNLLNACRDTEMGAMGMMMGIMMSKKADPGTAVKVIRNMKDPLKLIASLSGNNGLSTILSAVTRRPDLNETPPEPANDGFGFGNSGNTGGMDIGSIMGLMQIMQSFRSQPDFSQSDYEEPAPPRSRAGRALDALNTLIEKVVA